MPRPSIHLLTKTQTETHLKSIGLNVSLPKGKEKAEHTLASGQKITVQKTANKATSGGCLYEVVHEAIKGLRDFKVLSVSKNTNSFGLSGHLLMDRSGETYEAGRSTPFKRGEVIQVPENQNGSLQWAFMGFEIPSKFKEENAPANVIAEVWAIPEPD